MKKLTVRLLPLAAAMAFAGAANAQTAPSGVSIYGQFDAMYESWTNDNNEVLLGEGDGSRFGVKGDENLGNGLTAFFQIENRFRTDTGADRDAMVWGNKTWVGLRGGFGEVMLGRPPTALDSLYGCGAAACLDTIAAPIARRGTADGRANNGIRYTSPAFGPVKFLISHGRREQSNPTTPYHHGIAFTANLGNAYIEGGYQQDPDFFRTMGVNGGIKISPALELVAGYYASEGFEDGDLPPSIVVDGEELTSLVLGVKTKLGNDDLMVNLNRVTADGLEDVTHVGVTHRHSLSNRTAWISSLAYRSSDDNLFAGEDSTFGVQSGIRHGF